MLKDYVNKSVFLIVTIYILSVLLFGTFVDSDVIYILIGTSPILIHIFVVYRFEIFKKRKELFWTSPLYFPFLFILLWTLRTSIIDEMDGPMVFFLQIAYSYITLLLIYFLNVGPEIMFNSKRKEKIENQRTKRIMHKILAQKQKESDDNYNLAAQYYEYLKNYQYQITALQNELNTLNKIKEVSQRSKSDKEKYEKMLAEYKECSENYISHIQKLEDKLKKEEEEKNTENNAYKTVIEEYERKQKTYSSYVESLHRKIEMMEHTIKITKDNFSITLRSIEDKCKAINFVIGRVYSDKKGGSQKIRDLLHINRELYNTFSEITKDFDSTKAKQLMKLLSLIKRKLNLYSYPEKEVLEISKFARIKIDRQKNGEEAILEVLAQNDQDPIKDYYMEAMDICNKLMGYLKENYGITSE